MKKFFNVAGPCLSDKHYMLNSSSRLKEILPLIDSENYFVIHAARQSGKTTLLLELVKKINSGTDYYCLYCSLEGLQRIPDHKEGIPVLVKTLKAAIKDQLPRFPFAENPDYSDYGNVLKTELSDFCRKLDRPLVLFFDEADCLSDDTLVTFLRQIRNGYNSRSLSPFVHSLALVGMRNIRDYKAKIRSERETLGSASPFNIVTVALNIKNFSKEEIINLYNQHTEATGQVFESTAIDRVMELTQGQPWLVNAIAREVVVNILKNDSSKVVTTELVEQAAQNIIVRRDTHIDSLLERLKEERVQKIIEPIIVGERFEINLLDDDTRFCLELGLIRIEKGELIPSNQIYNEVILRTLSYNTQFHLENEVQNIWIDSHGNIDMDGLLTGFQKFWREHSAMWIEKYQYKEAAPHIVLQAFLQRIINGGGFIHREYASGRGRLDLCVEYKGKRYPIEIKIRYSPKTYTEGVEQLSRYMETMNCKEGWLVVFDKRKSISWSKKIFIRKKEVEEKKITIVGV